jgi:hypothetical protein
LECEAIVVHGDRITEANQRDLAAAEEILVKNNESLKKIKRKDCNKTLR